MRDEHSKEPDDFGERITGWHNLLGWGDGTASVAPYVPTPFDVVRKMLELVEAGPGDVLYDLGCGDGRFLITAIEEYNIDRAVGFELSPHLVGAANRNIKEKGLGDRAKVVYGDFMQADLSEATVITLYLTTSGNAKLRPKFIEELGKDTRIVSHDFPILDWIASTPNNEPIKFGTHKLFTYKLPEAYRKTPEETSKDRWDRIRKLFARL